MPNATINDHDFICANIPHPNFVVLASGFRLGQPIAPAPQTHTASSSGCYRNSLRYIRDVRAA
jgi:hypothetical protein